jgi:histidinol phosphatase-like PHP family hydrolase
VAPDNATLAELLALEAERHEGNTGKAFRRASRRAFTWPIEAATLVEEGRSLTELAGIGPFLERELAAWIDAGTEAPERPVVRRDFLTLTKARRILQEHDAPQISGDLQMHTTWSDGGSSLDAMAAAADARGYRFIAITDHSAGLRIVKGLDEAGLARQGLEIASLNGRLQDAGSKLRVLRSVEMNLSPLGVGDVDAGSLGRLDIVLGSFHSALRRTDDQTERYLAALRFPGLHVLGHPRGRIYNFRLGLTADWERVFRCALEEDKAVEIDAYPDRQDLNVDLLRVAADVGVRVSIGTDAHADWQLEWIDLGLAAALSAGVRPDRILNLMGLDELLAWTSEVRLRAA